MMLKVWLLAGIILLTRLAIIEWTLPYAANPAHEHPMFYDSGLVVHDQYKALRALRHFPQGLVAPDEAVAAAWPLLQRYIAAVPLTLWLAAEHGWNTEAVLNAPYVETAYKALLINRLVSVFFSVVSLLLMWRLLRRFLSEGLAFFLMAIFALTVSEIGLAIHEKTVSLMTAFYLVEALVLESWARDGGKNFKLLLWSFFLVGLAGTAREYGLLFGGMLAIVVILVTLRRGSLKFIFSWRALLLPLAIVAGIAVGSPDMLVEVVYWSKATLEPGGRAWHSTSLTTIPFELWALGKLLFGGGLGTLMFLASMAYLPTKWRSLPRFIQALWTWGILYSIIFILYPLKDPRFIAGLVPFAFLLIGRALQHWYAAGKRVLPLLLTLWFAGALVWGVSGWVFFSGWDTRLHAADEFNQTIPAGASVAEFFPPYHTLHVPVDDTKFRHYQYDDLHSVPPHMLFIASGRENELPKDARGEFIGEPNIWPEYIVVDYETDAYTYPSDQVSKHKFRNSVLASNHYELIHTYPKRKWELLGNIGLFGTKSRWVYLNPVVEIYKLKS